MKKGFTLVELMGVLIIIGLLCLIIIPITTNILKEEKEKQYERQITTITLATKNLVSDNLSIVPQGNREYMYITVGQLKSLGYIEDNLVNPVTEKEITDCARVRITKVDNSYEYVYDKATEEDLTCNLGTEEIQITPPTETYIRKGEIASYIVSINQDRTQGINEYRVDKSKIKITGDTDSVVGVVEGTGIYKITVRGGDEEGEVGIKLESGAIIKNKDEDIVGTSGLNVTEKVIVDNTAPQIEFGTNGSSSWAKSASSTITVTDALSQGNTSSYKYVYTTNTSTTPSTSFTSGSSYSESSGSGEYYLIASACDNAGNCTKNTSNVFKLDNTAPQIEFGTNGKSSWAKSASSTITVTDALSGGNTSSYKYVYTTNKSTTPSTSFTSGSSYSESAGTGDYYLIAKACDNAGNCTENTSDVFKLDNTAPQITSTSTSACTSQKRTITINASDVTSGIAGYLITESTSTDSSFNSITANSWTSDAKSSGTYYAWVKDTAGNISSYSQVAVGSCFTAADICSIDHVKLFGVSKGKPAGNFGTYHTDLNRGGKWGDWCGDDGKYCGPTSGYERVCITSDYKEYGIIAGETTADDINTKYGCSFSRYWCSCTGAF